MTTGHPGEMKLVKPLFKNDRGVEIAKLLWPGLEFEPEGSFWDKYGIDAHLNGQTVQIKYDRRIATSGNIYHEFYEKSAHHAEQPWRKSPGIANNYIFTTETLREIVGYLVKVDILAKAEVGKHLTLISETSIGILLSIRTLKADMRKLKKEMDITEVRG